MGNFEKCDQAQIGCAEKCGKYCWGPDTDMCQTGLTNLSII